MKDTLIWAAVFVVVFALLALASVAIWQFTSQSQCTEFASVNAEMETRYEFWNGCLVKLPNGMWLSAKNVRWSNGKIQVEQLP